MLTLLAPYILGVLAQIGALIGQHAATPHRGAVTATAGIDQADFALRLDRAQAIPSAITLSASGVLVSPEMGKTVTAVVVVVSLLVSFGLLVWLQDRDPLQYADLTHKFRGISAVSLIMIASNVVLGSVVYATHGSTVT